MDAPHIRAFLLAEEKRTSAASAAVHYRNIRVFFGWLASEGERDSPNSIDRVEAPKVTKKAKAFFAEEELARLLKTCSGDTFVDRRDTAIIRIFIDTGMRVSARTTGACGLRGGCPARASPPRLNVQSCSDPPRAQFRRGLPSRTARCARQ